MFLRSCGRDPGRTAEALELLEQSQGDSRRTMRTGYPARARRSTTRSPRGGRGSVRIRADNLPARLAAQRIVGDRADRGLEELHVAVGQQEVGATGVRALEAAGRITVAALEVGRPERDAAPPRGIQVERHG